MTVAKSGLIGLIALTSLASRASPQGIVVHAAALEISAVSIQPADPPSLSLQSNIKLEVTDDDFASARVAYTPTISVERKGFFDYDYNLAAAVEKKSKDASVVLAITSPGTLSSIFRRGGVGLQPSGLKVSRNCDSVGCQTSSSAKFNLPDPKDEPQLYREALEVKITTTDCPGCDTVITVPSSQLKAIADWILTQTLK